MKYLTAVLLGAFLGVNFTLGSDLKFKKLDIQNTLPASVKSSLDAAKGTKFSSHDKLMGFLSEKVDPFFSNIQIRIQGKITDKNGVPIPNANISIKQIRESSGEEFPSEVVVARKEWAAKSNPQGVYQICGIPPFHYIAAMRYILSNQPMPANLKVTVTAPGFKSESMELSAINANVLLLTKEILQLVKNYFDTTEYKLPAINENYDFHDLYKKRDIILNFKLDSN